MYVYLGELINYKNINGRTTDKQRKLFIEQKRDT